MAVIKIENLTKDYGNHRGVFNVSFEIGAGEVFGFLGPNGAGKTTTIRHLLGFLKPDSGHAYVNDLDTWGNAHITNRNIGYIPGEINFPEKIRGMELIKWMAEMSGAKNLDKGKELLELFQLHNAGGDVKKMSKGMKQKLGIICAFIHDPQILILDEPTSGLDPLMQDVFIKLLEREKKAGKTILLSSHMFAEVEKTCDRVSIIKQGEIVTTVNMDDINKSKEKIFKIKFKSKGGSEKFALEKLQFVEVNHEKNRIKVKVHDQDINTLLAILTKYDIQYVSEVKLTLEDYFMQYYQSKNQGGL